MPQELRTVIDRKPVEESLFIEKERAQVTLNSIGDAVLSTDVHGNVTYLNPVAAQLTGWTHDKAVGRPIAQIFCILDSETRAHLPSPVMLVLRYKKCNGLQSNTLLIRRDGMEFTIEDAASPIHDQRGRLTGALIVFHDASEARRRDTHMAHLAQHDFLTDLPGRMLLRDRIA